MQEHPQDREDPPEREGIAGEAPRSPDWQRAQASSQTNVRVSVQPMEGVAIPATSTYQYLPAMEGVRPGLPREEIAGTSGRAWTQGTSPVNLTPMDEYALRMQTFLEQSQRMMIDTQTLIQQSLITTTHFQEEVRGMYINQNAETLSARDERRTDLGNLSDNISRSMSLAVSTAINQATDRQTQTLSDLLLNRTKIQAEATREPRTSSATPSEEVAETEGPSRAPIDKGKARQVRQPSPLPPSTPASFVASPPFTDTPLGATTFQDQGPSDPGPSKLESSPRPPSEPVLPPNNTPQRPSPQPHSNGGGGGGGGGRGPGGPPDPPEPPDPPNSDEQHGDGEGNDEWIDVPRPLGRTPTGATRTPRAGERGEPPTFHAHRGPVPGFNWSRLSTTPGVPRGLSAHPPGVPAPVDRYSKFRMRICRGVTTAIRRVITREPPTVGPATVMKTVAAVTPLPKYGGEDDLEIFMKWLVEFLTFIDIHQLVGVAHDYNRTLTIGAALEGRALNWFDLNMRGPLSGPRLNFESAILRVTDEFLTPAAATKAQRSLERVQYSTTNGIRAYVRDLQTLSTHVFMPIDEFSLRRQILVAIPQTICNWLINFRDLSTSTSTVVEWVDAIEKRERELLEKEAYNASIAPITKSTTSSSTRIPKPSPANSVRSTKKAPTRTANTPRFMTMNNKSSHKTGNTSRPVERVVQSGPHAQEKQRIPIADIVCHACSQKGHYKGSRECPKTPSSARLHAMGTDSGVEDTIFHEDETPDEEIFDGEEYDGEEEDFGPTEVNSASDDDMGTGAIIANIHVDEEEDELFVHAATLATTTSPKTSDDIKVATELLDSIKEDYEVRGSGIKYRPVGKTSRQIKANSTKDWASNSNVRSIKPDKVGKPQLQRQGLPALIKINGVEAYTCWDSGSELDAISPDFIRAIGISPKAKTEALRIRLGTKGSGASTSYEVSSNLDFGNTKIKHDLDVVNLDRWDLLLGNPFCNKYGVVLDYGNRTIRFGNTVIKALSREEEKVVRKGSNLPRLHALNS